MVLYLTVGVGIWSLVAVDGTAVVLTARRGRWLAYVVARGDIGVAFCINEHQLNLLRTR